MYKRPPRLGVSCLSSRISKHHTACGMPCKTCKTPNKATSDQTRSPCHDVNAIIRHLPDQNSYLTMACLFQEETVPEQVSFHPPNQAMSCLSTVEHLGSQCKQHVHVPLRCRLQCTWMQSDDDPQAYPTRLALYTTKHLMRITEIPTTKCFATVPNLSRRLGMCAYACSYPIQTTTTHT